LAPASSTALAAPASSGGIPKWVFYAGGLAVLALAGWFFLRPSRPRVSNPRRRFRRRR
jgi:hypothetical protein